MYNVDDNIHFHENNTVKKGRVISIATFNNGRQPRVLFYTVQSKNVVKTVNPAQVVSRKNMLQRHMVNRMQLEKVRSSIRNIKEMNAIPADVRRIILNKINKRLSMLV